MRRYEISDEDYQRIEPLLSGKTGDPGRNATDNRAFINAVLWIARTGAPWPDLPERFGNYDSVYQRFNRWAKRGRWQAIFEAERLWQAIYPDLRRIAHHALRHRHSGHSLDTTALVNEAYLKLAPHEQDDWSGRLHFFSVATKAMRHILIDYARQRGRRKRGGSRVPVALDSLPRSSGEAVLVAEERSDTLLALDEALTRLESRDERLAQVVEYRFFGGLTEEEIADLLHVTERTVRRDWRRAKAWLALALSDPPSFA